MLPPVSCVFHSNPHARLMTLLGNYALDTLGVGIGGNGSIRLDPDNLPQPDGFLLIESNSGGQPP